jgi:hypothetical protein
MAVARVTGETVARAANGLDEVSRAQQSFDAVAWEVSEPLAKLRHVILHLNKAIGEISAVAEQLDHQHVRDGVASADVRVGVGQVDYRLADLVTCAAQLANLGNVDLGSAWRARMHVSLSKGSKAIDLASVFEPGPAA